MNNTFSLVAESINKLGQISNNLINNLINKHTRSRILNSMDVLNP